MAIAGGRSSGHRAATERDDLSAGVPVAGRRALNWSRSLFSPLFDGAIELIEGRAQAVDEAIFTSLNDGDVLFIDSSHVSKTGSDVNRLILEVLPILAPGVFVHFHDIFMPRDYPKRWVIEDGSSWNEQYLLQAFLAFNTQYGIVYGCGIAFECHLEALTGFLKGSPPQGGSLCLRRRPDPLLAA